MKKVFACLSTILLMLVAFGLVMQPAKLSAVEVEDGKFIEDPTLEEGDIPIYVMNSIQTTFPNLYDANAKKDDNYGGPGRDYYWNEIKFVVPQIENNQLTGKQYTVYTQGNYDSSKKTAAATKIYLWVDVDGVPTTATQTGASVSWTGQYPPLFGDVSLSGVRYNVSGQEVVINNIYNENGVVNGDHSTDCIYLIFDGQGKAVRGAAHDSYFSDEKIAEYGFTQLFGYKDGKIVLRESAIGAGAAVNGFGASDAELDRVQVELDDLDNPLLDEITGEPLFDDDGNPLYNKKYVDGEEANLLSGLRYVWQWYSEEDFDAESVNAVQYLEEGWRYDKWDYAYADPNGGYVCLAFAPNLAKFAQLTEKQYEIHNASIDALLAAGELNEDEAAELKADVDESFDETTGETTYTYGKGRDNSNKLKPIERPVIVSLVIPVNGVSYRFGYLDYTGNSVEMHFNGFCKMFEQGLLYGRNEEYRAHARTYNFTATGLKAQNAVVEGESFILREENGKYVFELKEGATISPKDIISINGMLGGYGLVGDGTEGTNVEAVQSYKNADVSELEYTMDINGEAVMRPAVHLYETLDACADDIIKALISWKVSKGVVIAEDTTVATFANNTYDKFADGDLQLFAEEVPAWAWFVDYYTMKFNEQAAKDNFESYDITKANALRWGLHAFLNKIKAGSWPYSPDFTDFDTSDIAEYSPEKEFRFDNWEQFKREFLVDFATEVYDNPDRFNDEETGEPTSAVWADLTYGVDPDKCAAFFQSEKWAFLGQELDALVAGEGVNYKGAAAGTSNYYRWNMHAYLNKITVGTWPYSIKCADMAEPNWIGVPLEKDWNKISYATEGLQAPYSFALELTCYNKATGITDTIKVQFEVVNVFTPVIRIDESALKVALGQTSMNLRDAVKAYDAEYKGGSVYGSDISRQYLEFVLPEGFDPENLKGGVYEITAVAKAPADTGLTTKQKFTVRVIDEFAPQVEVRSEVSVVLGEQLDPSKILVYAYDDVDGDLLRGANVNWIWYTIKSDYEPESSFVGEDFSSSITVYDSNGNSTTKRFLVKVCGIDASIEILDKFEELEREVSGSIKQYQDMVDGLAAKLADAQKPTDQKPTESADSCAGFGAATAGLLASLGLVLVFIKKRH